MPLELSVQELEYLVLAHLLNINYLGFFLLFFGKGNSLAHEKKRRMKLRLARKQKVTVEPTVVSDTDEVMNQFGHQPFELLFYLLL